MRRPIIIGNWKMNLTVSESLQLARAVRNMASALPNLDVGIAPPFTVLRAVAKQSEESRLVLAAQNCHFAESGAYTGEVSVGMLADVGCKCVLIGHSERRQQFGEDNALLNRKLRAVLERKLLPVLCVGETLAERQAERTFTVVTDQLISGLDGLSNDEASEVVVAYEPVWAIGTGKVATNAEAQEVHAVLRRQLADAFSAAVAASVRIQYGGSVKPSNITGLMAQPDIDGALVGGASLDAESFGAILKYDR